MADWGRLLFGYFFLAKQEKVTSCRATPDGVDVEFVLLGIATLNPAYKNSGLRPSFDTATPTQDERFSERRARESWRATLPLRHEFLHSAL